MTNDLIMGEMLAYVAELKNRAALERIAAWRTYTWREGPSGLFFCDGSHVERGGLHSACDDCQWQELTHKKLLEILDPKIEL